MKVATYVRNYGDADIKHEDVARLTLEDLPSGPSPPSHGRRFHAKTFRWLGVIKVSAEKATAPLPDRVLSGRSGGLCAGSLRLEGPRAPLFWRTFTAASHRTAERTLLPSGRHCRIQNIGLGRLSSTHLILSPNRARVCFSSPFKGTSWSQPNWFQAHRIFSGIHRRS
jgi:hypothetical protein